MRQAQVLKLCIYRVMAISMSSFYFNWSCDQILGCNGRSSRTRTKIPQQKLGNKIIASQQKGLYWAYFVFIKARIPIYWSRINKLHLRTYSYFPTMKKVSYVLYRVVIVLVNYHKNNILVAATLAIWVIANTWQVHVRGPK